MSAECVVAQPASQWQEVSPLSSVAPWLHKAFEDLQKLHQLGANWDGYGSPAVNPCVLEQGARILSALEIEGLPAPVICPVPGGGIQFEWEYAGRAMEIEVLPDGTIQYLAVEGGASEEDTLPAGSVDYTRRLLAWLIQG
jgi:hypothetical protein